MPKKIKLFYFSVLGTPNGFLDFKVQIFD